MASVDHFHFCPACGQKLGIKYFSGKERPYCSSCDRPYFQDPKVAAAVFIEEQGKVLLVQRIMTPQKGMWTLPAGFIDDGEDPQEAAIREALEETGLDVRILNLMEIISGKEHPRGASFVLVYRAERIGGHLNAGDDAGAVRFFAQDDLPPIAFKATEQIIEHWIANSTQ
jgi:8-oxo-dGTP diphosphatase